MQTAFLAPKGLLGLLYYYGLYPFHGLIFGKLIDRIAARAESLTVTTGVDAATSQPSEV